MKVKGELILQEN